jgi:hypothetical protein
MSDQPTRSRRRSDGARNRRAPRNQHICLAWVQALGDDLAVRVDGIARVMDLSSTGVGLVCAVPFEPGQRLTVELLVVANLRLKAEGQVVHVTPSETGHRIGIAFAAAPVLVDAVATQPIPVIKEA